MASRTVKVEKPPQKEPFTKARDSPALEHPAIKPGSIIVYNLNEFPNIPHLWDERMGLFNLGYLGESEAMTFKRHF